MTRRPLAATIAFLLWLVLAVLWLAWAAILTVAYLGASTRRGRRKVARAFPSFPRPARILDAMPGRPRPVLHRQERRRMSSSERERYARWLLTVDGEGCQLCFKRLDLLASHRNRWAPEVHHVIPWSRGGECVPANLVLLHRHCNQVVGARVVPHLLAHVRQRHAHEFEEAA